MINEKQLKSVIIKGMDIRMSIEVKAASEIKTRHIPMYKVIMHNDPITTMEFVISILRSLYRKELTEAKKLTMEIHETEAAVVGVYPLEHAEFLIERTHAFARGAKFPLKCTMEPE